MSKAQEQAQAILDAAERNNFKVSVCGGTLKISRQFTPGSNEEFVECDMSYYSVLGLLSRTSPGSDWGTDGGGIGACSAINSGYFTMNRSGGSKRVLNALKKML